MKSQYEVRDWAEIVNNREESICSELSVVAVDTHRSLKALMNRAGSIVTTEAITGFGLKFGEFRFSSDIAISSVRSLRLRIAGEDEDLQFGVFKIGKVAAKRCKWTAHCGWYWITEACFTYLRCHKFTDTVYDNGLPYLAAKYSPADVSVQAFHHLVRTLDCMDAGKIIALMQCLAADDPTSGKSPFQVHPIPYTALERNVLDEYRPQAFIIANMRDCERFITQQLHTVRLTRRAVREHISNAKYMCHLIMALIDALFMLTAGSRTLQQKELFKISSERWELYKVTRDSDDAEDFITNFGRQAIVLLYYFTGAGNVQQYYKKNRIKPNMLFKRLIFPVMRKQVVFLLGKPHTGKTHFAECIMDVFQGTALSLNNRGGSCDFEIAPCYKRRLCVVDDIEYSGLNILHNRMHLVNGSRGACNEKNKDVLENMIFPPLVITGNDNQNIVSKNRAMPAEEPSRLQILFSRMLIIDVESPLPQRMDKLKFASADILADLAIRLIASFENHCCVEPQRCMKCYFCFCFEERRVREDGPLTFNSTVPLCTVAEKLHSQDVVLKFVDMGRSESLIWNENIS